MINRAVRRSGSGLDSLALIWIFVSRLPWWGIAAVLDWLPPFSARLRSWLLSFVEVEVCRILSLGVGMWGFE